MSDALVDALRHPQAYPHRPAEVGYLQTHISHLFFAGELVFKVKKPIDLGFLDFRTLDARAHMCAEELRLNRRLAADTYLGVVAIRRTANGELRVDPVDTDSIPQGEVIDWAVVMQRLPANRMLDQLLDAGDIDNEKIRALAETLTRFHATAATGAEVDCHGDLATVRGNCEENFAQTRDVETISPTLHRFLEDRTDRFLREHQDLFERRVAQGRIRDGHGDLHAGNICMMDSGIVIYDCLEFAPRFRCADVAADLAFLIMDLDLRRFRAFGQFLLREYITRSDDTEIAALIRFYKGYRAFVRGKVTTMQLAQSDGPERDELLATAASYFHLAASYELPPALILCCGLPGSGKSWLAQHLARPFEAALENSDVTRKRLAGIPPDASAGTEIKRGNYGAQATQETYTNLLDTARSHLGAGRTVVVDAGFRSVEQRQPFRALGDELGVATVLVHVDTDEATTLSRLRQRAHDAHAVSDAGETVYRAVKGRFEPPTEFATDQLVVDDGVGPPEPAIGRVIECLIAQLGAR